MAKVCLVIIDGLGVSKDETRKNATKDAYFLKELKEISMYYELKAHGPSVGLIENQMGNSEVGHLTISAGRVLDSDYKRITESIESGQFYERIEELLPKMPGNIHLVGLLSDGGVHSHIDHALFLNNLLQNKGKKVFVHAISDGRDTAECDFARFYSQFNNIASISGRYYAMDRDRNDDRTERVFKMLTEGKVSSFDLKSVYKKRTDEYFKPVLIKNVKIDREDTIIFFNFRADRMKQLVNCFLAYPNVFTMTVYSEHYQEIAFFPILSIKNSLGDVVSQHNLIQSRIAETEKQAHVTYFFNGRQEEPYENEQRFLIKSDCCRSFNLQPYMKTAEIADQTVERIEAKDDLIIVNFASPDMVGHTGDFDATKSAVESVSIEIMKLANITARNGYALVVTSDHGNSEDMGTETEKNKKHTNNDVPLFIRNAIGFEENFTENAGLSSVAPTILEILGLEKPEEMTGESLLKRIN